MIKISKNIAGYEVVKPEEGVFIEKENAYNGFIIDDTFKKNHIYSPGNYSSRYLWLIKWLFQLLPGNNLEIQHKERVDHRHQDQGHDRCKGQATDLGIA